LKLPKLKIRLNTSAGNETWALDNLFLTGIKKNTAIWENAQWSNIDGDLKSNTVIINDNYRYY
jgi:hypothetical protein